MRSHEGHSLVFGAGKNIFIPIKYWELLKVYIIWPWIPYGQENCFACKWKLTILLLWTEFPILKEMRIPDHLTCLLRNLYAGQEPSVRTGHGTTDWFQIGKGVHQGYILSSCLFNLHAEYIMRNAGLDEAQAGIKIAGRNINNLRYADDTTLMAESERGDKKFG